MTTYLRPLPKLALHLMAVGWSAAGILLVATWIQVPLPLWLLLLAYLLPALGRSRSAVLGTAAAVFVAAAAALLVPFSDLFLAVVLLLVESARALTLAQHATVFALRSEQQRGLALLLFIALLRAIVGRPDIWPLALLAALYLAGALFGLPLAHSRDSGEEEAKSARYGLRLAGLLGSVAAAMALVIGLVHYGATHHVFDFLGTFLGWIFTPLAYLGGYLVEILAALLPHRPKPDRSKQQHQTAPKHGVPKMHAFPHAYLMHIEMALIALFVVAVALVAYYLYRRQLQREVADSPGANLAGSGDLRRQQADRRRSRARDYGEGARRVVRQTVGLHLRRVDLPPGTTARSYAKSHGWDDELLAAYEHARYGFGEPFQESKARTFVESFRRRFGRRPPRRQGPGA